jgi:hypothetical protein
MLEAEHYNLGSLGDTASYILQSIAARDISNVRSFLNIIVASVL